MRSFYQVYKMRPDNAELAIRKSFLKKCDCRYEP